MKCETLCVSRLAVCVLSVLTLFPLSVAMADEPEFQFDVDGDNSSIVVDADLRGVGRGGTSELPDDRKRARGDAVTDAPRRVWAAASDSDLGCLADKSSTTGQIGGTACQLKSVVCSVVTPGASMSVGRDVDPSTGAPIFGTERLSSCSRPSSGGSGAAPAVPVVTESDFQSLGVEPLVAHIGPPGGWIPIGIDMIAWAEADVQTFDVEMLGQAVQVRATPVKYVWDFGDGTVLTTSFPGRPYPERDVSMRQPIAGTIEVASEKLWVYSDLRESRLVSDEVPEEYRREPERGPDTLGPVNPDARVETLTEPGVKD